MTAAPVSSTVGRCLCGGVTVTLPHAVRDVEACHCAMCRRWGSGPWLGVEAPPGTAVEGDTLTVYPSSSLAERGFCSRCGSNVFYRFRSGPELVVSSGLFRPCRVRAQAGDILRPEARLLRLHRRHREANRASIRPALVAHPGVPPGARVDQVVIIARCHHSASGST